MMRYFPLVLFGLLVATGCRESTPLEKGGRNPVELTDERFGKEYLTFVNRSEELTLAKVYPGGMNGYHIDGEGVAIDAKDLAKLKDILLIDKSYIFDMTKRCRFIPEYALRFRTRESVTTVLFSPSCKQMKVIYGNLREAILDIDPSFEEIKTVVGKYNPQLEGRDEK